MPAENRETICAELRKQIAKLHKEYFGRGPSDINVMIINDVLFITIKDCLSTMEKRILKFDYGKSEISRLRNDIFSDSGFEELISETINNDIVFVSSEMDYANEDCYLFVKCSRVIS